MGGPGSGRHKEGGSNQLDNLDADTISKIQAEIARSRGERVADMPKVITKSKNPPQLMKSIQSKPSTTSSQQINKSSSSTGKTSNTNTQNINAYENIPDPDMPSEVKASLNWYAKTDGYISINSYLASGKMTKSDTNPTLKEVKDTISKMDEAFKNASIPQDATVYRGMSEQIASQFLAAKEGSIIQSKTFMSTSALIDVASDFASGRAQTGSSKSSNSKEYIMVLKIPKGTKALSMKNHAPRLLRGENEVLINRGTKLKAIGSSSEGNRVYIHMEALT
jgi:hypothetical protein